MRTTSTLRGPVLVAAIAAASLLGACASKRPGVTEQIGESRASIEAAQAAVGNESSAELASARLRLAQAQEAARHGDHSKARRLADEAEADAALARAKMSREKSEKAAAEIDKGLATLREELTRQQGTTASPVKP